MSITIEDVVNTDFVASVKQAYQGMGLIKPYARVRNNVVGSTCKFRHMGKGMAKQKLGPAALVQAMDIVHTQPTATLSDWYAAEFTDIFDQATVNFDEKQELASCIAGAIGRRCDQLLIDAMDASTPLTSTVDAGASNLGMAQLIDAKVALVGQGVGNGNLCGVIESGGLGGLLNDEKASSSDYQNVKALVNGDVNTLNGFNMVILEDRDEGGLTEAASKPDAWFFHRDALGLAIGIDLQVKVTYEDLYTSWLTNGIFKAGSVVIDSGGLVKVQYTKTA